MNNKRFITILTRARALINKGWCQGLYARDKNGKGVGISSPEATCFCAMGAIQRAVFDTRSATYYIKDGCNLLDEIIYSDTSKFGVMSYNDEYGRTKEEVLALFDKAIGNG